MSNTLKGLILTVVLLLVVSVLGFKHIESLNQANAAITEKNNELQSEKAGLQATLTTIAYQQKSAAEIDAKYYQEMTDAKNKLSNLKSGIANGTIGLHINATCEVSSTTRSASTSSLGNAGTCRLSDSAQQDYYAVLDGAETLKAQVRYLQSYINTQCKNTNQQLTNHNNANGKN